MQILYVSECVCMYYATILPIYIQYIRQYPSFYGKCLPSREGCAYMLPDLRKLERGELLPMV